MEIAILNLMADKRATEQQLAEWLGHTILQVKLTFIAPDRYIDKIEQGHEPGHTPREHIEKFYQRWSRVRHQKFDGLIITGVNARERDITQESVWPEVVEILEWSKRHVLSTLFLCWGALAALHHFHAIGHRKAERKVYGLYDHKLGPDKTGLLRGFPDLFQVPVSRWRHIDLQALAQNTLLEAVATSTETGANIIVESDNYDQGRGCFARRIYVLNHPEYAADTLRLEYERDHAQDPATPPPAHYFQDGNTEKTPPNSWRHTAQLYANWVHMIYEATPFDIADIPNTFG